MRLARCQRELVLLGRESRIGAGAGDLRRKVGRPVALAAPLRLPELRRRDREGVALPESLGQPPGFRLRRRERLAQAAVLPLQLRGPTSFPVGARLFAFSLR